MAVKKKNKQKTEYWIASLGKTLNANISTSYGAAQWMRAQVGKRRLSTLCSVCELGIVSLCLWKDTLRVYSQKRGPAIYPSWCPV